MLHAGQRVRTLGALGTRALHRSRACCHRQLPLSAVCHPSVAYGLMSNGDVATAHTARPHARNRTHAAQDHSSDLLFLLTEKNLFAVLQYDAATGQQQAQTPRQQEGQRLGALSWLSVTC